VLGPAGDVGRVDDVLPAEQGVVQRDGFARERAVEDVRRQGEFVGEDPFAQGVAVDDPRPRRQHYERSFRERPDQVGVDQPLRLGGGRH